MADFDVPAGLPFPPMEAELVRELPEGDQWLQVTFTQLHEGVLLTFSDITARKRMERELDESRGQQASLGYPGDPAPGSGRRGPRHERQAEQPEFRYRQHRAAGQGASRQQIAQPWQDRQGLGSGYRRGPGARDCEGCRYPR